MRQFMAHTRFRQELTEEFISLMPEQRAMVNSLMRKGIIASYTLSADKSQCWIVMSAKSEIKVIEILADFPLRRFMKTEIHELMFHNSTQLNVPKVWLN